MLTLTQLTETENLDWIATTADDLKACPKAILVARDDGFVWYLLNKHFDDFYWVEQEDAVGWLVRSLRVISDKYQIHRIINGQEKAHRVEYNKSILRIKRNFAKAKRKINNMGNNGDTTQEQAYNAVSAVDRSISRESALMSSVEYEVWVIKAETLRAIVAPAIETRYILRIQELEEQMQTLKKSDNTLRY